MVSILLQVACYVGYLVVFGLLSGLSAKVSFGGECPGRHENVSDFASTNYRCSIGIHPNNSNYDRLCSNNNPITSTSSEILLANKGRIIALVKAMIIIGCVQILTSFLEHYTFTIWAKRQACKLSVSMFRSILQRNMAYFDTGATGELNSKLSDNVDTIDRGLGLNLALMIETLLSAITSVIVSFVYNWKLTLIMLCTAPFVLISSYLFSKLTTRETMNEMNAYSRAGQIAQEVFSSIRTVFSLNSSDFEKKRYESALAATRWSSIRKGAAFGVFFGWGYFMVDVVYGIGFIFGLLISKGQSGYEAHVEVIIIVVLLFAQGITLLSYVGAYLQALSEARGAATDIITILNQTADASKNEDRIWDNNESNRKFINLYGDIAFNNVNFSYPSRSSAPILQNLSLVARAGETTAIVGASGCGKSTCTSLLLRYYEPTSGTITINDQPTKNYDVKQLRQHVGIVSQEPILFATTVYENICYGKQNATKSEVEQAAKKAFAHDFIVRLPNKYETLVGERGSQLSGGEKQRIALARAIIREPELLLLDEATSALDNESEKIVQQALNEACRNRTTIVIAHRLTTVQNANRIYVLDAGRVVEEGTHEVLLAKEGGHYRKMYEVQQMKKPEEESEEAAIVEKALEEPTESETDESLNTSQDIRSASENEKKELSPKNQRSVFLRLLMMARSEWTLIIFACIMCGIAGAIQPIFAFLLLKLVTAFGYCTYSTQMCYMLIYGFSVIALGIFTIIVRFFQFTLFALSGSKLTHRIRTTAFACFLRQEVAYFDCQENSSSSVCNRLSTDASAIQQILGTRFGIISENLVMFVLALILGGIINWQITLILFAFMVFGFLWAYVFLKTQSVLGEKCGAFSQKASSLSGEIIQNMRIVKQLNMEKTVLQRYSDFIWESYRLVRKYSILVAISYTFIWASVSFLLATIFYRMLIMALEGQINPDSMIMVYAFGTFFMQAIRMVLSVFENVADSVTAAENIFDLFDRTPTIDNSSSQGQTLPEFRGEIEFDKVTFMYPSRPESLVLNNLRLSIKSGQRVALVGKSGCGKSTVIQLLERFYDANRGQVRLDGVDIRELNIHWIRSQLALVSQEPVLFDLTIAENIAYAQDNVSMQDIIEVATKTNIHEFIRQLPDGYQTRVGMKGAQLSGGEKQRIAIARALIRRPKVLLLDEATSALDTHNEQIVQSVLEQIQTENPNLTSLTIAHRLSTIRSSDAICVLEKGRVTESGNHMELMLKGGVYYKLVVRNNDQ